MSKHSSLPPAPARPVVEALAEALEADGEGPVERRETHLSTVLLTASRAYKLKRPVRFDFVDQRDPVARRRACEREAELNEELAPGLVLGVRGVLRDPEGRCALTAGNDPAAIDWAVEMVRFDERRTLEARLRAGTLAPDAPGAVGRRLAEFHRAAPPVPGAAGAASTVDENLTALLALLGETPDAAVARGLRRATRAFSRRWSGRLAGRAAAGLVVDGHGDLRAEHVLLDAAGIRFVDRLEIDELRVVDVADDLAFLLTDLERLDARPVAAAVLEGYRAAGGDRAPDELMAWFGVHRAAVRAKVALLQDAPGAPALLELARRLSWRARGPLVLLVTGPPASGKSTLARSLAAVSGLPLLSSDDLRKADGAPPVGYSDAERAAVYAELGRRAAAPPAVVVDATFGDRGLQDAFFGACPSRPDRPVLAIDCVTDPALRDARARERRSAGGDASDAGPAEASLLALRHERVGGRAAGHLELGTSAPLAALAERVEAWLDEAR
jgi:aminoglycoside phosphotransferase family enzyme/predicted kinase